MTAPLSNAAPGRRVDAAPAKSPAAGPDLRVVLRPRRRRPVGLLVAVGVIALFGALFLNAIFHSVLVSGQARLDNLNQSVGQAESRNEQRRLQVATLESPGRIVQAATGAGMVLPAQTHWVMPRTAGGGAVSSTTDRVSTGPTPTPGAAELASRPLRQATAGSPLRQATAGSPLRQATAGAPAPAGRVAAGAGAAGR